MKDFIEFNTSNLEIGLLARNSRKGPEQTLVRNFVDHITNSFKNKSTKLAVFYEPQLDTGFPDIVFVEYLPRIFEKWNDVRSSILPIDIKVLNYLHLVDGSDSSSMENKLGIDSDNLLKSLERLLDSKLIHRKSKQWKPFSLRNNFAIKEIVAIEAKISNLKSAFEQAQINKWYASESYILLPTVMPNKDTINTSQKLGVGIYTSNLNGISKVSHSMRGMLPSCYASWLFNEWTGRYLHL